MPDSLDDPVVDKTTRADDATGVDDATGATAVIGGKKRSPLAMPHMFVILLGIIAFFTALTWVIPAGKYKRTPDPTNAKRMIIDPNSFTNVDNTPVGLGKMLLSLQEGLIAAAPISFLIFMASAALYMVEKTGALDALISSVLGRTKKGGAGAMAILVFLMVGMSFWSSTGTFSYEEIVIFIPIFCTLAIALGYDALVGMGMSFVAVGIGFGTGTVNPFTVGVAQGVAQVPLFSGLSFRIVSLVVLTAITVGYVLVYGAIIKKDPSKSLVRDVDFPDFTMTDERLGTKLNTRRILVLLALAAAIVVMVWGLSTQGWYINEVGATFFGLAVAVGIIGGWTPNKMADVFVAGLQNAVVTAMVVGFSRGILVVLEKGQIVDTMIHSGAGLLNGLPLIGSATVMLFFQQFLNLIVPSGSGQAAVSMPIIAPISDLIGMERQLAVLIFQFGDGLSNLIWPTSFVFIGCALAKVPVVKYYKWFLPLAALILIAQLILVFIAIQIGYA